MHIFIAAITLALVSSVSSLKIATSLLWIEHTPQAYAIKHFYNGSSTPSLHQGGVANLGSNLTYDLAANAETQGLKQYANHKNIRLIYMICEAHYRIVANRAAGINKLQDLKGKKIGTINGSSARVFVDRLLASGGLKESEYTTVSGNVCMKTPCANNTFPSMIASNQIDAFGVWEPAVELGVQALGDNAITFQNGSVYREMYAFYSTTEKLNDPAKRKDIVAFVRALNQTLDVYNNKPESVYQFVADTVGMDPKVVVDVWEDHKWTGVLPNDLFDLLVDEDKYLARKDNRTRTSKADLRKFLDTSIIEEL